MLVANLSPWIGSFGEIVAGVVYFAPTQPRLVMCDYWGKGGTSDRVLGWTRTDGEIECIPRYVRMPNWVREADVVHLDEEQSAVTGLMEVKTTAKPRPPRSFQCQPGWASTEREARTREVPTWLGIVKLNPAFLRQEVVLDRTEVRGIPFLRVRSPGDVFRTAIAKNRLNNWVSEVGVYGPEGYEILNREPDGFVIRLIPGAPLAFRWSG